MAYSVRESPSLNVCGDLTARAAGESLLHPTFRYVIWLFPEICIHPHRKTINLNCITPWIMDIIKDAPFTPWTRSIWTSYPLGTQLLGVLAPCHGESGFPRWGHPRTLSPSARGIPEYCTRSEYGIPNYSPWVILHPLDGTGAGALQSVRTALRQ